MTFAHIANEAATVLLEFEARIPFIFTFFCALCIKKPNHVLTVDYLKFKNIKELRGVLDKTGSNQSERPSLLPEIEWRLQRIRLALVLLTYKSERHQTI